MTDLSRIPAVISKARAELARANYEADLREWKRYEADTKEAVRQWGADQVMGLVQQIIADLADAAQEKRAQEAQAEYEREMKHKPMLRRYEYTLPE